MKVGIERTMHSPVINGRGSAHVHYVNSLQFSSHYDLKRCVAAEWNDLF